MKTKSTSTDFDPTLTDGASATTDQDKDAQIAAKDAEIADLKAKLGTYEAPPAPIQEYPKWVSSKDGDKRVVQTKQEHEALGEGWN